jgi:folate-dependent phosphoribosylglycinamide formyltransferase PurN
MDKKIKKVCILFDEPKIFRYFAIAINKAMKENNFKVSLIIIRKQGSYQYKFPLKKEILRLAIILFRRLSWCYSDLLRKIPLDEIENFKDSEKIYCPAIKQGKIGTVLPDDVISLIKEKKIDLIIRRGFGILQGEALKCAPFGVISYHSGDLRKYRSSMSCVAAYINDEDNVCLTLQKLTNGLDRGEVVWEERINIKKLWSYRQLVKAISLGVVNSLSLGIKKMNDPNFRTMQHKFLGKDRNFPNWQNFFKMVASYIKISIIRRVRRIRFFFE